MSDAAIVAFNIIGVSGLVLLVVVFLTGLASSQVVRSPTWFSYIAAGVVVDTTNLLIMGQQIGPDPVGWVCYMQAILVYPIVILATWSSCILLAQIYFSMRCIERFVRMPRKYNILFTIFPSAITICLLAVSATFAALHPGVTQRDPSGMRCHFNESSDLIYHITIGTAICGVVLILIFEALLIIKMYRNKRALEQRLQNHTFHYPIIIRATFFNIFILISVIISFYTGKGAVSSYQANDLEMVLIPAAAGILFGCQKDILSVWISWIPGRLNPFKRHNLDVPDR